MDIISKKSFNNLFPYLIGLLLAIIVFSPNLFLDFYISDDYHFFRSYTNEELSYTWTHNYDIDGIENDGFRPLFLFIFNFVHLMFGFNGKAIYAFTFLILIIKALVSVKLASYFIKNKTILIVSSFLSLTAFDLVRHHFWATEIPHNVSIILLFLSIILLIESPKLKFKHLAFLGSLVLVYLAALIKEVTVPFLVFPPLMFIYYAIKNEFFSFNGLKNKLLFILSCSLPIIYTTQRLMFFTTDEYQFTALDFVKSSIWNIATIFNRKIILGKLFGTFDLNIISMAIMLSFNWIIVVLIILAVKNIKKIYSDKFSLILLVLLLLETAIIAIAGGWRNGYIFLFFAFIFFGRILDKYVNDIKLKKAFIIFIMIMIISNVFITFDYVFKNYHPKSKNIYEDDLKILSNPKHEFLFRDEYKIQLDYLKAKIEKEKIYFIK